MTIELDDLLDAVVTIGNSKRVKCHCEPNVMLPLKLEGWMVKRSLVSWEMLIEAQKEETASVYHEGHDEVYQCLKCGEMETLTFTDGMMQSTRKFAQVGDTVYHIANCGECRRIT